jgi:hypothetical protein
LSLLLHFLLVHDFVLDAFQSKFNVPNGISEEMTWIEGGRAIPALQGEAVELGAIAVIVTEYVASFLRQNESYKECIRNNRRRTGSAPNISGQSETRAFPCGQCGRRGPRGGAPRHQLYRCDLPGSRRYQGGQNGPKSNASQEKVRNGAGGLRQESLNLLGIAGEISIDLRESGAVLHLMKLSRSKSRKLKYK